jgi:hypothetical protein
MRLIFGMVIGASLTVGGAYITDAVAGAEAKPLVNWDVVVKNIDDGLEEACRLIHRASSTNRASLDHLGDHRK